MNGTGVVLGSLRPGCKACRWSFVDGELTCRRNPPQVSILMIPAPPPRVGQIIPQVLAAFPIVRPDMFCGEWASAAVASAPVEAEAAE